MTKKTPTPRKDRIRAKKDSHKLTPRHVAMIRSQKGIKSVRAISKWFAKETHYIYKVSHYILTEKFHQTDDNKISIYDLIEEQATAAEIEQLDPKKVGYD